MTKKYHLYQIDSFTTEKFTGNPAGVITNADGLTDREIQQIARELNNSETAFIINSGLKDCDVYIRYFTPLNEVPICGHATIAAHYARAIENNMASAIINQKSGVGILPVEIINDKGSYKIIMTQGKIEFGALIEGRSKGSLLTALSLNEAELLECPIQIVSTGHSKVMIGIKSAEKLNSLRPNYSELAKLSSVIHCNGYYVFTLDSQDEDILINGRMFAPAIGINEDPVTGNANGPLGAYLIKYGLVEHDGAEFSFNAKQGEAIGRTGIIGVEVAITNSVPSQVKISGGAVIVFKTELII